ncbi:MAG: PD-(D/E)XK nuclease family protein [Candidatus Diapherotrites archaeon]|nr:PD-(D/E)XK nuclease family protein [Candidatus Diapherotrites archaeon]
MRFSYSKLQCFRACPKQFEFRYLLKPPVPSQEPIQQFVGKTVHETLESLFLNVWDGKSLQWAEVVSFYEQQWNAGFHEGIQTDSSRNSEAFFQQGRSCLEYFFSKALPFRWGKIRGVEQRIYFPLTESAGMQGVIDLLVETGPNRFEIHDYKTLQAPRTQEELDADEQLAIYQIGIESLFPGAEVTLVWHFLAAQADGRSSRTREQLDSLRRRLVEETALIRKTAIFSAQKGPACECCSYKPVCPAWNPNVPRQLTLSAFEE